MAIKEYFPMSTGMVSRDNKSTVVWSSTMLEKTGVQKGFDSFLKEARKMVRLGGIPNVVGVKAVFIQNETAYIVMDFIEGETLLKKLQREGPMDFDTCVKLLIPIMQALAEVHKHGIIHRDISPDNIMVQKDGKLILLDLGAAKDLEIQGADGSVQSSQLVAKQGFSPVEQYGRTGKIGPWTDVYAMAATIYYCCTGKLPPAATDRTLDDTFTCQPLLTREQFNALSKCMAIAPEKRLQDMDALLQTVTSVPKPPESKTALPKWLLPAAAGFLVVGILIFGRAPDKALSPREPSREPSEDQAAFSEPIESAAPLPEATTAAPTQVATEAPTEESIPPASFPYLGGDYSGQAVSGKPDGEGSLCWDEGKFIGTFRNGYPEGHGTFVFADSSGIDPVEGQWSYGEATVVYTNGNWSGQSAGQYTGMLLQGKPCGYGTVEFDYGGSYQGTFWRDYPAGQGLYSYRDGASKSGLWSWEDGLRGSLYPGREGGTTYYTGMAYNGEPCGFGSLRLEECGTFYGEFAQGSAQGYGIYAYRAPDGSTVEGDNWRMVSGDNKFEHSYYGLTLNGAWQGFGLGITQMSYHYVGEIRDYYRNGYGRLFTPNNTLYQGGIYVNGGLSH